MRRETAADYLTMADSSEPGLSKKQKGRLKKLLKRSKNIDTLKSLSGVSSISDWQELTNLYPAPLPGPCVLMRQPPATVVEGADHRDILFRLLHRSHKRKRAANDDTDNEPRQVPDWASLHNAPAVERAAVMEIHTNDMESIQALIEEVLEGTSLSITASCPTRWFQKPHFPKSISEACMYAHTNPPKRTKHHCKEEDAPLYDRLLLLKLTDQEWQKESYPMMVQRSSQADEVAKDANALPRPPTAIDPSRALAIVKSALVTVTEEDEDESLASYVTTRERPSNKAVYAVDCEMVRTKTGMELARATVLQMMNPTTTKVVFDVVVRPRHAVLDYLTEYSGITADRLKEDSVVELEQVQASLLELLTPGDILIGHSLENDLRALRYVHPTVIDTAVLFRPPESNFKFSLRHLAEQLLRRQIRQSGASHCSDEDATVALQLAVRRAVEGPSFGIYRKSSFSQLLRLASSSTVVCVGPHDWLTEHVASVSAVHALACDRPSDPNAKALAAWLSAKAKRPADLVWAHWSVNDETSRGDLKSLLQDLVTKISSRHTILAIAVQSRYQEAVRLTAERKVKLNPKTTIGWTPAEQEKWLEVVGAARVGAVYWVGAKLES